MPSRPREHQLESVSRLAFEAALSSRFVFRTEHPDYGIDGDVEEFDQAGRATGVRFYVQLKATDEPELRRALRVSVPLETASYYRSLPLPVLMVRYHAPSKRTFGRWFHQFDPYYGGLGARALRFRWSLADEIDPERRDGLVPEVQAFHRFHSSSLPLPLAVHVKTDGAFDLAATEIAFSLRRACTRRPDIVRLERGDPPLGASYIEVSDSRIAAHLATVTSATLHIKTPYDAGPAGEQIGIDGLVMLALAFEHLGQADLAARMTTTYFSGSFVQDSPEAGFALSSAMAQSRRIIEALEVAESLDSSDDVDASSASFVFTLPALFHGTTLSETEREAFRRTLAARIERRKADGRRDLAAGESVTLGNHYRAHAEPQLAVERYEDAAALDPSYRDRPHWWFEYAGVLFGSRRYAESARAYERATELGSEPIALALQADATMFAGRYNVARDLFTTFNENHFERGDEYRLKELALDAVLGRVGVEEQVRDPTGADRVVSQLADGSSAQQVADLMVDALRLDVLNGTAWSNLATADALRGDSENALIAYVAGAVFSERDPVAWAFAIDFALRAGADQIFRDLITTARRFAGDELLEFLPEFARTTGLGEPFLETVEQALGELPDDRPEGFDLRFVESGRDVETVHFGADDDSGSAQPPEAHSRPRRLSPQERIGRNDPCWCGSGRKFKKCHGA